MIVVQHPGTGVGVQPGEGAEAARHQLHGVEGGLAQAAKGRVGTVEDFPLVFVVQRLTATKLWIAAFLGKLIERIDRGLQLLRIDPTGVPVLPGSSP